MQVLLSCPTGIGGRHQSPVAHPTLFLPLSRKEIGAAAHPLAWGSLVDYTYLMSPSEPRRIIGARPVLRRALPESESKAVSARLVIFDLEESPYVELCTSEGETHYIPLNDAYILPTALVLLRNDAAGIQVMRFQKHHPQLDPQLVEMVRVPESALPGESLQRHLYASRSYPRMDPETHPFPDATGIPILRWEERGRDSYWAVAIYVDHRAILSRAVPVQLEARWDDSEGIARLVHAIQDEDAIRARLEEVDSVSASALATARAESALLEAGNTVEGISVELAREVLKRNQAHTDVRRLPYRKPGELKLVSLRMNMRTRTAPICILVTAPQFDESTEQGERGVDSDEACTQWIHSAQQAFQDAGWHTEETPLTQAGYATFAVTRIPAKTWNVVKDAVRFRAAGLQIGDATKVLP